MTREELQRANTITKEIEKLENFIYKASNVWTGKLISRSMLETKHIGKFIFKSSSYGTMESAEYEMNKEMKNKVLQTLKDRVTELYKELDEI